VSVHGAAGSKIPGGGGPGTGMHSEQFRSQWVGGQTRTGEPC
jgi:hypothetical protein